MHAQFFLLLCFCFYFLGIVTRYWRWKKSKGRGFIPAHGLLYSHLSPGLLGRCVVKQDKVAESMQWNDGVYSTMARKLAGRRPVVLSKA